MPDCKLITGDCLEVMKEMEANSIDTIITDPPYGLSFMGKEWDHGVPGVPFWEAALRVAKPGAMLLAFGGTRTYHRLTVAIEDAGWEIRDCLMWLYGSGFPKSHDISKAIDKAAGAEREVVGTIKKTPSAASENMNDGWRRPWAEDHPKTMDITAPATEAAALWDGWGTALKPAWEPIILAMKPLDGTFAQNAQTWGVAGLNINGGRIGTEGEVLRAPQSDPSKRKGVVGNDLGISRANLEKFQDAQAESIRRTNEMGRWPANVLLDEEAAAQLDAMSGTLTSGKPLGRKHTDVDGRNTYGSYHGEYEHTGFGDSGGASRFFYVAKASRSERNAGLEGMPERDGQLRDNGRFNSGGRTQIDGEWVETGSTPLPKQNFHPTVKPVKLMEYLCRLTATPTGGTVLDPFCGSGSTGVACMRTGRHFIGIDISAEYIEIAQRRIEAEAQRIEAESRQPTLFDV